MASSAPAQARQQGLQQAASALFAVMAIVPLLVFAYTLWYLGALQYTFAQASLALTLGLALLGFWMFRSMLNQMSEAMQGMTRMMQAVARQPRAHEAPTSSASAHTAATAMFAAAATTAPAVATTVTGSRVPPPPKISTEVAGLGSVWELGEMTRTMDELWRREAHAHLGRRVQVTVANAHELSGRLLEATGDGLLLEQGGGTTIAITYRRVQGIEPLVD